MRGTTSMQQPKLAYPASSHPPCSRSCIKPIMHVSSSRFTGAAGCCSRMDSCGTALARKATGPGTGGWQWQQGVRWHCSVRCRNHWQP
jgi:hypothetical protein